MFYFKFNDAFDEAAKLVNEFTEIDCDYVHNETWEADAYSWYKVVVYRYAIKQCEGHNHCGTTISLVYDHPEDGYSYVLDGRGYNEEDALGDFLTQGKKLKGSDKKALAWVIENYVESDDYEV